MDKPSPPVTPSRQETRQEKCQRFLRNLSLDAREAHLKHTAMLYEINKATKPYGSTEPKPNQHSFSLPDGATIEFGSPPRDKVGVLSTGDTKSPGERVSSPTNRSAAEPMDEETDAILKALEAFDVSMLHGGAPTTAPPSAVVCATPPRIPRQSQIGSPATQWSAASTAAFTGSPSADHAPDDEGWF